jgi:hypothetical protein
VGDGISSRFTKNTFINHNSPEVNAADQTSWKVFAKYYEDLSIPKEELFDKTYVNLCNMRQSLLEEELEKVHYATEPFTEEEVQT